MNKRISSFYKKMLATVLVLCLFSMLANTCPIRNLLTSVSLPAAYTERSVTAQSAIDQSPRCAEAKVQEALLVDRSQTNIHHYLPVPIVLKTISVCLLLLVLHTALTSVSEKKKLLLSHRVPLFLQNQSIII